MPHGQNASANDKDLQDPADKKAALNWRLMSLEGGETEHQELSLCTMIKTPNGQPGPR